MLASLRNVPRSRAEVSVFAFANADHHRLVAQAAEQQYGLPQTLYALDPIPESRSGFQAWLRQHQEMHNQFTRLLRIQSVDLSILDPTNPAQLDAWVDLHFREHFQAADIFGVF